MLISLALLLSLAVVPAYGAEAKATLSLDLKPPYAEGEVFTVTVTIPKLNGIESGFFKLLLDTAALEVTAIDAPSTFAGYGTTVSTPTSANSTGFVSISIGNGAIAEFDMPEDLVLSITFSVKEYSAGDYDDLIQVDSSNYYFEDDNGDDVPAPAFEDPVIEAVISDTPITRFWVRFNGGGHGNSADFPDQQVAEGNTADKPADPTEDGWTFGGWFTDSEFGTEYVWTDAVTDDVQLYAKWTEVHDHVGTLVPAADPDCEHDGNSAYYTCTCGKFFSDSACTTEIDENSWVIPASGHTPAAAVQENFSDSTCAAEGSYDEVVYCSVCSAELSRTPWVVGKKDHTLTPTAAKDATCVEAGNIAYWQCTACNEYFSDAAATTIVALADTVIPIDEDAHDWGEWTETTAPTETEDGVETRVCSRDSSHKETRPVAALGHTHVGTLVPAVPETCTEAGNSAYYTCTCSKFFSDSACTTEIAENSWVIAATGHDWNAGVVTTAPTCTEKGVKTYTCANDASHTYTEDIDALGHDWGAWTQTLAPTEDEDGVETRVCSRDASHTDTRPVPALGHTHVGTLVPAVPETCTEAGSSAYYTCTCGRYFSDAECTNEIEEDSWIIPAAGHTPAAAVQENVVPATCTDPGSYDEVVKCSVCGTELSRTAKESAATGHSWGPWSTYVPATETEEGVGRRTCANDPSHFEEMVIPKVVPDDDEPYTPPTPADPDTQDTEGGSDTTGGSESTDAPEFADIHFTDVKESFYFYDAVRWAVAHGLEEDGDTFDPEAEVDRAAFVSLLYKLAGEPETAGSSAFTDIPAGIPYEAAIDWAVAQGITDGTSEGHFSPEKTITRAQAITMLQRCAKASAGSGNPFTDVHADSYFCGAVSWAYENGITDGKSADIFGPEDLCTKAQAITFIYRMVKAE